MQEARPLRKRSAALLAALVVLMIAALAPATASAATCEVDLTDSFGAEWEIVDEGYVEDGDIDGGSRGDAFDGWTLLNVSADGGATWTAYEPSVDNCTYEDGDREVVFPTETIAGLQVSRKIYVPASGLAFARFLNVLHNPGSTPVTVSLDIGGGRDSDGDLGSDSNTVVHDSSSGDGNTAQGDVSAMTSADHWATSWDGFTDGSGSPNGDPTLAHNWQSGGSLAPPDTADDVGIEGSDEDAFYWQFNDVTIQPGETVIYMSTEAMRANNTQSGEVARTLAAEPDDLYAGMSVAELFALRNWTGRDRDQDGVDNEADNCPRHANPDQSDIDGDGQGDACDSDRDGDGISNAAEEETGTDPDDADTDGDGVSDGDDVCPRRAGSSADGCPTTTVVGGPRERDTTAPTVTPRLPKRVSFRQVVLGFRVGGECDERCGLRFQELVFIPENRVRIAGFNHVLARAVIQPDAERRSTKIRPCISGSPSKRATRRCRRDLLRSLRRSGKVKIKIVTIGTDDSGNRTRVHKTIRAGKGRKAG